MTEVWAVVGGGAGLCAAKGVGFGPQIEFGATERGAGVADGGGKQRQPALVEIAAAERGNDGGGWGYLATLTPDAAKCPHLGHACPRFRHTRALFPVIPALAAGISPCPPPNAAPRSVAPDLIWGPYGGCERRGVPNCPANGRQRQLGPPALRTALGMGPKSSLGRRTGGARRGLEAVWGAGAALGEIPAAERGYDGGVGGGLTEEVGSRRWCCSRRDTRGKRGYDGSGGRRV